MSKYLAAAVYAELKANGCELDDEFELGTGWVSSGATQTFFLPEPDEKNGNHWFDADVVDDILVHRWMGFDLKKLERYAD